jgi:DNA-binding transcriptional LysR family regulator
VRELAPGAIEDAVLENSIDLGITCIPSPRVQLELISVGTFSTGVFAARGSFVDVPFEEIPFAVPIKRVVDNPKQVYELDMWPQDRPRLVRYQFELMETALDACRRGVCAVHCPDFVVELHNQTCATNSQLYRLLPTPTARTPTHTVFLVKRRAVPEDARMRLVARALRRVLASPQS